MWKFVEAIWTVRDSPWTVWAASGIIYAIKFCFGVYKAGNGHGFRVHKVELMLG